MKLWKISLLLLSAMVFMACEEPDTSKDPSVPLTAYSIQEMLQGLLEYQENTVTNPIYVTLIVNNLEGDITVGSAIMMSQRYVYLDLSQSTSLTSIGVWALIECDRITGIIIPSSVDSMGDYVFTYCPSLNEINVVADSTVFHSENGVLYNKEKTSLVAYPAGKSGSFNIPNSVTRIEIWAFAGCTGLTSINIPNSVTSIGDRAFYGCTGLVSVTIPGSVESIGVVAFSYCISLESVIIQDGVNEILIQAFADCSNLVNVTIPGNINIYYDIFWNCNNLTRITFEGTNVTIYDDEIYLLDLGDLYSKYLTNGPHTYIRNAGSEVWLYYIVPTWPKNLSATLQGHNQIYLTWDPVPYADSYNIYRKAYSLDGYDDSEFIKIGTSSSSYYGDSMLPENTYFVYYITAYNAAGESTNSHTVDARTYFFLSIGTYIDPTKTIRINFLDSTSYNFIDTNGNVTSSGAYMVQGNTVLFHSGDSYTPYFEIVNKSWIKKLDNGDTWIKQN